MNEEEKGLQSIELGGTIDASIGTVSIDLETAPQDGQLLMFDGTQMIWTGVSNTFNTDKRMKPKDNFIEHFDICGPGGAVIERILKKKHSERTEEEKENLRYLMRQDKPEKPKIKVSEPGLEYGPDYVDNMVIRQLVDRAYAEQQMAYNVENQQRRGFLPNLDP